MSLTVKEEVELLHLLELDNKDKERNQILNDESYFLKNYAYIEDKTNPRGISLFNLWPKQEEVLTLINTLQFLIILKARQLGLTWLVIGDTLWQMLRNYGYTAIAISKRDKPDAIELGKRMRLILRYLPNWLIREKEKAKGWRGLTWRYTEHEILIERPDGEPSRFLTLAASPDTAHSFTANRVILDEWALHPFADDIWTGAFPTMNRTDFSGQVIGLSTGRIGTLFEKIWTAAKQKMNRFTTVFLSWRADPRRTIEWYEQTKLDLPNTWRSQYPENEGDAFTVGEEAFFLEYQEEIHAPFERDWYPPNHWKLIRTYDPGFGSRACCKWYAISPDGSAVCYREYYPQRVIDEDQANEINRLSKRPDGTAEMVSYTVSGVDAWNKNKQTTISTADIFRRKGIPMRKANTDLENGWRRLHRWLKVETDNQGQPTALLRFTKACVNTLRTYPSIKISQTNPETVDDGQEDHPQDCDRYFAMSRPEPDKAKPKTELEVKFEELKETAPDSLELRVAKRVLMVDKVKKRGARDVGDVV
jgi:hypothetical protein